jgi:hypothetical protein
MIGSKDLDAAHKICLSEFKLMFRLEFDVRQDKVLLSSFNLCNNLCTFSNGNYVHVTTYKHYYFLREIQHRKR